LIGLIIASLTFFGSPSGTGVNLSAVVSESVKFHHQTTSNNHDDKVSSQFVGHTIDRLDALIVPPDPTFPVIWRQITEFAISNRLPTMFGQRRGVEAGGLMGYEPNLTDMYNRAAALVDKILKGAKPADLPVEFPTRFQFIINLKTAKKLGLTVPPALITNADEVIE
jgi:putative tryptophan/tyrosine transport system substrate-binding protein